MTYNLFWSTGTCARVPFVALEEIGEPFEVTVLNRFAPVAPELLAVNPKGKVPVLVTGERTITENPAILTFLARKHPEAGLLPVGDTDTELSVLETMCWFASGIHPSVGRLRFPGVFSTMPGCEDGIRAIARGQLEQAFAVIEARLEEREWLFGEWSIVDAYLLWLWFRATGSGMDGSVFPRCNAHAQRCEARPSVAKVLAREVDDMENRRAAGQVPPNFPDFQVGCAPKY
jgi:glutathione S-transferase